MDKLSLTDLFVNEQAKHIALAGGRGQPTNAVIKYHPHDRPTDIHLAVAQLTANGHTYKGEGTPAATATVLKFKATLADPAGKISEDDSVHVTDAFAVGPTTKQQSLGSDAQILAAFGEAGIYFYPSIGLIENRSMSDPIFDGVGVNDMRVPSPASDSDDEAYSGTTDDFYEFRITGNGSPDTFKWRKGSGAWSGHEGDNVNCATTYVSIAEGVKVKWTLATGHTIDDGWFVNVRAAEDVENGQDLTIRFELPLDDESETTIPENPGEFELESPADGASSQPIAGTLSWHTAKGDDVVYDLYMDKTADPTTLVEDDIEDTFYAYSGLDNSATYYWKIVARNVNGSTTSDSIFSFGTVVPS